MYYCYQKYGVNMKKIVINSNPQNLIIDFDEVLYITTFRKKVLIVKLSGEEKILNISLGELYEKIEPMGFIRCHKSFIVNIDYIESFNKAICTLKNKVNVPLGRQYYKNFKKVIYNQ